MFNVNCQFFYQPRFQNEDGVFKFVSYHSLSREVLEPVLCDRYIKLRTYLKSNDLINLQLTIKFANSSRYSLLNITVVAFIVLPLGSYALMPAPSPPSKQFWNWFCGMVFRAAVVFLWCHQNAFLSIFPLSSGTERSHWGLDPVIREGVPAQLFVY
jgi:hypothetical protein